METHRETDRQTEERKVMSATEDSKVCEHG